MSDSTERFKSLFSFKGPDMNAAANGPPLSVVMPVHNAAPFIDESIRSILSQSFRDFEFVILDDASSDGSPELLQQWEQRESRIRVFRSEQQLGLAGSANLVVSKTSAPIIARMDADDVSHPERLTRQLEVLKTYQDVVAVGSLFDGIDTIGRVIRPLDRWRLLHSSQYIPFPHGSAMFRRAAFDAVGGYQELMVGEDQDFFLKLTRIGRVVTLPAALYHFRYHATNTTLFDTGTMDVAKQELPRHGDELATLYLQGAMRLWSGQPPRVLPELIANGILSWDFRSAVILAWALLGSTSPAVLRYLMRVLLRTRDALSTFEVSDGTPYEWRPKWPIKNISFCRYETPLGESQIG
jgi:glycosyltransferase involved in cell wall biosynthesis